MEMNNFTPRAQQVLALAAQGSRPLQSQLRGHGASAARFNQAGPGRCGQRVAEDGLGPRDGPHGSREADRQRPRDQNGGQHSLHPAREEGPGAGPRRKPSSSITITSAPSTSSSACSGKGKGPRPGSSVARRGHRALAAPRSFASSIRTSPRVRGGAAVAARRKARRPAAGRT